MNFLDSYACPRLLQSLSHIATVGYYDLCTRLTTPGDPMDEATVKAMLCGEQNAPETGSVTDAHIKTFLQEAVAIMGPLPTEPTESRHEDSPKTPQKASASAESEEVDSEPNGQRKLFVATKKRARRSPASKPSTPEEGETNEVD